MYLYSYFVVYVTWKDHIVTSPTLIYHHLIASATQSNLNFASGLACKSSTDEYGRWHLVNGDLVMPFEGAAYIGYGALSPFVQYQTPVNSSPKSSRLLRREREEHQENANGLFTCRHSNGSENGAVYVGVYKKSLSEQMSVSLSYLCHLAQCSTN